MWALVLKKAGLKSRRVGSHDYDDDDDDDDDDDGVCGY